MRARDPGSARLPLPLQRRSSDEFAPLPYGRRDRGAVSRVSAQAPPSARRLGMPLAAWCAGRMGTAASLRALNAEWDDEFYVVPEAAVHDADAADECLGGGELVFDVQTHYVARERVANPATQAVLEFIRSVAPDRWKGLRDDLALSLADYLRCVYLESETAVAVLTSAPGEGERNILTNSEIAGTRELVDRLGGSGRLLHHAIVHPNLPGELDAMERIRERCRPAGWKVYTLYPGADAAARGWMLDDERTGRPFLERSLELGVRIVCAHKGLSALAPAGSPADIGPAAAAFPAIDFLVYHSGYEVARGEEEEGPYRETADPHGTDRLVRSLRGAGIGPGRNVYAELGSTWFVLLRRPREAAHVLGKLLAAVGEDRVLWGTDSIWYGSPQPLIDAFRAFQIPPSYREQHGYPELTPQIKEKILGLTAARVYGVDAGRAREAAGRDDLAWVREGLEHERRRGTPSLRL